MNRAIDITRKLIFGTSTPSLDYNDHIRPYDAEPASVTYSAFDYMTQGGGRFAVPATFDVVDRFFQDSTLSAGIYTAEDLASLLGVLLEDIIEGNDYGDFSIGISQYATAVQGPESYDFPERAFIDGSTRFTIQKNSNLRFVVNENLTRQIENMEIIPQDDKFKFDSDEGVAEDAGRFVFQPDLNPYYLARGDVNIRPLA